MSQHSSLVWGPTCAKNILLLVHIALLFLVATTETTKWNFCENKQKVYPIRII